MTGHAIYVETIQWLKIQSWESALQCKGYHLTPGPGRSHRQPGNEAHAQLLKHLCSEPVLHKRRQWNEKFAHHSEE